MILKFPHLCLLKHSLFWLWFLVSNTVVIPALWAWGERGHNTITQIACKLIVERNPHQEEFTKPFQERCEMLGHLSNIPDIYWRSIPKNNNTKGADSAHYIDIDYFTSAPTLKNVPVNINDFYFASLKVCESVEKNKDCKKRNIYEMMDKVGTNPWRTMQIANLLKDKFKELSDFEQVSAKDKNSAGKKKVETLINEALAYAGILSHYVGDTAQPLHNTKNYDGFETGQGGVHVFFETALLGSYDFSIDQAAFERALKTKPAEKIIHSVEEEAKSKKENWHPKKWALAFALESYGRLGELLSLDKKFAIRKPSQTQPIKRKAERLEPAKLRDPFRDFVVERLAVGADMLAYYWYQAWVQAGRPNMKDYQSYTYIFQPNYIEVNYTN